jgi:drug/metabolite transporter (DMT)-like permease
VTTEEEWRDGLGLPVGRFVGFALVCLIGGVLFTAWAAQPSEDGSRVIAIIGAVLTFGLAAASAAAVVVVRRRRS